MDSQLSQGLGDAWALITTFVPKLLGFLLVLLIGWLLAKALSKAVELLLTKTGFARLVEKAGLGGARSPLDAGGLIVKLVFYFVLLIALQFAFGVFGPGNAVSSLLNDVISFLPRVVVAIVLVLIASAIARVARDLITGALAGRQFGPVLGTITYVFLLGLGIIAALNQLGIATTVTEPVLITVLATVGGVIVVGAGGGLIRPMQHRWEYWLNRAQSEAGGAGQAQAQPPDAPWERNQPQPPPSDTPTPPEGIPRAE